MSGADTEPVEEPGRLYVVATPIGNLRDLTLRALEVFERVDVVACEDTRSTRRLLSAHGLKAKLVSCHAHNEARRSTQLVERLLKGEDIALVSDAGTPGLSDPGARLIANARAAGVEVVTVPGASAVSAALAMSGFAADRFLFLGFLPAKGKERRALLDRAALEELSVVLFEAPHRIRRTLSELAERCPERPLVVAREMTKKFEEALSGTLAELSRELADVEPRGEYTLVLGPQHLRSTPEPLDSVIAQAKRHMQDGLAPSKAARKAAKGSGQDSKQVYLALRQDKGD